MSFLYVDESTWFTSGEKIFAQHSGTLVSLRGAVAPLIYPLQRSATLEPGLPLTTICNTPGFIHRHFHEGHRTNERPNIHDHFVLQTLTHTLGGSTFPDLLPFLAASRKTVVYCATIELCWRVAVYLWGLLPPGNEKLTRVRLYHTLCWPEANEETVATIRGVKWLSRPLRSLRASM